MKGLYSIKQIAQATGYTSENIRRLEKIGIVKPVRDTSGRRLFCFEDIGKIIIYKNKFKKGA